MSAYPSHEFQGLTEAGEFLLAGGRSDRRLTEDQLLQLRLHIKMIASWADRVPQKTNFYHHGCALQAKMLRAKMLAGLFHR